MTGVPSEFLSTTSTWFDIWLEAFGDVQSGVWRSSGLAIPYQIIERRIGPVTVRAATGAANSHTPRYDVLGDLRNPAALGQMMAELRLDMLEFSYLAANSKLMQAMQRNPNSLIHHVEPCESAPYVDCRGGWDDYWSSRGKSRTEWGRRERRLMSDMHARFECLTEWPAIEPLFAGILGIEASGWKGRQGSAINQEPATLAFYTRSTREWAAKGMLRLFILFLDNIPVAFELDVEMNGVLNCVKHGYLEDHAKLGPGQVLRTQVLRWAFAQPKVTVFDMFGPSTEAKLKWATGAEPLYTARIFRRTPRGLLAWLRWVAAPYLKAKILSARRTAAP